MQTECPMQIETDAATLYVRKCSQSTQRSDEGLLEEYARTGNEEAFRMLVQRYEREMYSYLRKYLGDSQLAEDAFQETFLKLHLKCSQFDPRRKLRPWLYTIANNQALDLLRRKRRHKKLGFKTITDCVETDDERHPIQNPLQTRDKDPNTLVQNAEDRRRISSALEKIPDKLKLVIELVVFQGLTYRAAAETLGIPNGTLKSRLHTAIKSLHKTFIAVNDNASQKISKNSIFCKAQS
jgi:RNA polymerase sigma-70 factor, ECF subfamily